jgi:cell wall-associated NlpC family hydrolase
MKKTAAGLAAYAKAQIGMPYWYGTFGLVPTEKLLNDKARQYPNQFSGRRVQTALAQHVGKFPRCFDCIGLIKGYMWTEKSADIAKYNAAQDITAGTMRGRCTEKGQISTLPETPGILVFIATRHVGVYIGGGKVVEAKGFEYGVVETALKKGAWDTWGKCPWLTYPAAISKPAQNALKVNTFSVGDHVKIKPTTQFYETGGVRVPAWVKAKIYTIGRFSTRKNQPCALLKEINTWCDTENLTDF